MFMAKIYQNYGNDIDTQDISYGVNLMQLGCSASDIKIIFALCALKHKHKTQDVEECSLCEWIRNFIWDGFE